jgi:hypothetical protein
MDGNICKLSRSDLVGLPAPIWLMANSAFDKIVRLFIVNVYV